MVAPVRRLRIPSSAVEQTASWRQFSRAKRSLFFSAQLWPTETKRFQGFFGSKFCVVLLDLGGICLRMGLDLQRRRALLGVTRTPCRARRSHAIACVFSNSGLEVLRTDFF